MYTNINNVQVESDNLTPALNDIGYKIEYIRAWQLIKKKYRSIIEDVNSMEMNYAVKLKSYIPKLQTLYPKTMVLSEFNSAIITLKDNEALKCKVGMLCVDIVSTEILGKLTMGNCGKFTVVEDY